MEFSLSGTGAPTTLSVSFVLFTHIFSPFQSRIDSRSIPPYILQKELALPPLIQRFKLPFLASLLPLFIGQNVSVAPKTLRQSRHMHKLWAASSSKLRVPVCAGYNRKIGSKAESDAAKPHPFHCKKCRPHKRHHNTMTAIPGGQKKGIITVDSPI